jgi:enterochelin esterase-like enzyme
MDRIASPPLTRADFGEMITDERLAKINAQLERQPYRPMIVAMPYLPDMLGGETAFENAPELSEFVVDRLLPRLYSQTPALGTPASTGIDGVSLGGRAALLVGLSRPMAFGAVAGTQAAVDPAELGRFAAMARKAQQRNPALSLRLLTSTSDYYHDVLEDLHEHFAKAGVRSELLVVSGTHSYAFNRGPGSYEMLLHHSAVLHEARK